MRGGKTAPMRNCRSDLARSSAAGIEENRCDVSSEGAKD
jgi:hypothetical protein